MIRLDPWLRPRQSFPAWKTTWWSGKTWKMNKKLLNDQIWVPQTWKNIFIMKLKNLLMPLLNDRLISKSVWYKTDTFKKVMCKATEWKLSHLIFSRSQRPFQSIVKREEQEKYLSPFLKNSHWKISKIFIFSFCYCWHLEDCFKNDLIGWVALFLNVNNWCQKLSKNANYSRWNPCLLILTESIHVMM